ncbi:glycosyltransferase [Chelatococcus asaccharovorans]|uniref:glycosyltransferase n=1 Tax=Chelatococcus asaccharovorans TaxID=28210 RepID=UPI00224C793D|nr:glycosyltransferase [Chelatococcus asaccharovorans]CAH1651419.1 Glycosyltransferase involved in cell wall biosynthesis [Chelatococcus asaccharovorans]CAH1686623.1 Glycosyltransferase involved in cell wall biosynthesis [Chelatococcus asaccharovorans]
MKILFVHQNFPGQFGGLVDRLLMDGADVAGIGAREFHRSGIRYQRYGAPMVHQSNDLSIDDASGRLRRASAVAAQARLLQRAGFEPDVMIVHSGWGEALYLRDIFPRAKLVCYCEFFYHRSGTDIGFDPEFPIESLDILHRLRVRNAFELASVDDAVACISPTLWQRSTYPVELHSKIAVLHEGIDVSGLVADEASVAQWRLKLGIRRQAPIITYVARYLEPHRGFHILMRAVPILQSLVPDAHILVIGAEKGGYGPAPANGQTWKEVLLQQNGWEIDHTRLHFLGNLPFRDYVAVAQMAQVHVYLTYPFVLSWSALEAMAKGHAIVASDTPPVSEFMTHGETARLVNFFDSEALARATVDLLRDREQREYLGRAAKDLVRKRGLDRAEASQKLAQFIHQL